MSERFVRAAVWDGAVLVFMLVAPRLPFLQTYNPFTLYAQDGRAPLYWGTLIAAVTVAVWHLSHYLPLGEESGTDDDAERPEQPALVEGSGGADDQE